MAKSSGPRPHDNSDWTVGAVGLILMLIIVSLFLRELVIRIVTTILYFLWQLADFPHIHQFVAGRINILARVHNDAENVSWSQFIDVLNFTGSILLVALIPLAIVGVIAVRRHQASRTSRPLNINTLPGIMARISPSIIPALHYGDARTQLLNVDPPVHRWAMWPEEFAIKHKLVVNRQLDREKATKVFIAQLGTPLSPTMPDTPEESQPDSRLLKDLKGWRRKQLNNEPIIPEFRQFNPYERAMFAIFGLQHFLDKRKDAERLLDNLNRSTANRKTPGYPDLRLAERDFYRIARDPEAIAWVRHYRYARTAITALHDNDLHLPGARFRWLKGLDRTLWYALSSTGRPSPFVEGAGVISQAQWERLAAQYSVPLKQPVMTLALDALEDDLISIGAIAVPEPSRAPDDITDDAEHDDDASEQPQPDEAPAPRHINTFKPRMK